MSTESAQRLRSNGSDTIVPFILDDCRGCKIGRQVLAPFQATITYQEAPCRMPAK